MAFNPTEGLVFIPVTTTGASRAADSTTQRQADYIVAVVNRELVTNSEVQSRLQRIEAEAARSGNRLPGRDALQREGLETRAALSGSMGMRRGLSAARRQRRAHQERGLRFRRRRIRALGARGDDVAAPSSGGRQVCTYLPQ